MIDDTGASSNVQVGIRLKPLTTKEDVPSTVMSGASFTSSSKSSFFSTSKKKKSRDNKLAWNVKEKNIEEIGITRKVEGKSLFAFDHIFEQDSTNFQIYNEMIRPLVREVANGKNGTVFCYGQTGSGKTYTMQGANVRIEKQDGVLPLAARDIIEWTSSESNNSNNSIIRVSYFEIYNEQVRDLLSDVKSLDGNSVIGSDNSTEKESPTLLIREDSKRGIQVNCNEVEVKGPEAIMNLLRYGNQNRTVAFTRMNASSSRSHAIFRLIIQTSVEAGTLQSSTLNLVDLAGSENTQMSDISTKKGSHECGKINTSLLSLSRVIYALSQPPNKRPKYISYRDSNLTRILRPHLSGNALIAILCCISSDSSYIEETRSTLRFASRAKLVKTKATVNKSISNNESSLIISQLREQLSTTKKALMESENRNLMTQKTSRNTEEELQRIKQVLFGDCETDLISNNVDFKSLIESKLETKQSKSKASKFQDLHHSVDHLNFNSSHTQLSPLSFQRITRKQRLSSSFSQVSDLTPPREVFVVNDELKTRYNNQSNDKSVRSIYVVNLEQRAKFLEERLRATEDLVETQSDDLRHAKAALSQLLHKNMQLGRKTEKLNKKLGMKESFLHRKKKARYNLLKWSIYCSIFFFVFRQHELYIVTVFFIWLSLESYTNNNESEESRDRFD